MHAPGCEWKRWHVRGSRSSTSQWMGLERLAQEVGSNAMGPQAKAGLLFRPCLNAGPSTSGLASNWADELSFPLEGEALKGVVFGPLRPSGSGWAVGSGLASSYKEKAIPSQAHHIDNSEKKKLGRRQQPDLHHSMAVRVLEEEAARWSITTILGARRGGHSGKKWVMKIKCRKARWERRWLLGLGRGQQCRFLGKEFGVDYRPD
ncbi:hypothetical protein CK203_050297 [Vitis vinifera]|uniref:Uncharacterized protein n=1 Tax=Vitis vinifera TaxID=29760 RepID=A0A438GZI4_VITVI|nr:hypothetical protein CK203_050297 [Vitis vinifera]